MARDRIRSGAARALGMRSRVPETVLLLLIALCMIATLTAVGALLATALVVVPAATVRLWTKRLPPGRRHRRADRGRGGGRLWASVKLNAPRGGDDRRARGRGVRACRGARAARAVEHRRGALAAATPRRVCSRRSRSPAAAADSAASGGHVVATTTQIGDWTRAVGGDAVDVHQILKANTDPHDYEPRPADVAGLRGRRVVFTNGDNLDTLVGQARRARRAGARRSWTSARRSRYALAGEQRDPSVGGRPALVARPVERRGGRRADRASARQGRPRPTRATFERRRAQLQRKAPRARPLDPLLHRPDPTRRSASS